MLIQRRLDGSTALSCRKAWAPEEGYGLEDKPAHVILFRRFVGCDQPIARVCVFLDVLSRPGASRTIPPFFQRRLGREFDHDEAVLRWHAGQRGGVVEAAADDLGPGLLQLPMGLDQKYILKIFAVLVADFDFANNECAHFVFLLLWKKRGRVH